MIRSERGEAFATSSERFMAQQPIPTGNAADGSTVALDGLISSVAPVNGAAGGSLPASAVGPALQGDSSPPLKALSPASGKTLAGVVTSCLREIEFYLVIVLIALVYLTRVYSPPVRGEESRRATVTMHMVETGNWIVPQQQGNTMFMSARPPMQNWLMLAFYAIFHTMDEWGIRLPSILGVFGTSILIYMYGRSWMSRLGAFTGALAFATMLQVMELGRTAETDLVLTVFMTLGLLGWHYFMDVRKMPGVAWVVGYAAIAAATLTKGVQAPAYFLGATCVYLMWTRRLLVFFNVRHLLGVAVYVAIVGAWLVPYYKLAGLESVRHIFFGDVVMYGETSKIGQVVSHLLSFPFLTLGCLLPWVLLTLAFVRKRVRQESRELARPLAFVIIAFCVAFPTVWLMVGSKTRFLLNMYPCAAICIGIAVDRAFAAWEELRDAPGGASRVIREDLLRFTNLLAVGIAGGGLVILGISVYAAMGRREMPGALALPRAGIFAAAALVLAVLAWRKADNLTRGRYTISVFCIAAFFGLLYNVAAVDDLNRRSQRVDLAFEDLYAKHLVPEGQTLVSLDECPHLINYLHFQDFGKTIPRVTLEQLQGMRKTGDVYLVSKIAQLPPECISVAALPLDRYRDDKSAAFAYIGKWPKVSAP